MNGLKKICISSILCWLSSLMMTVSLYMVFWYAPGGHKVGGIPRVFYFYFSSAMIAVFSFFLIILASLVFLKGKKIAWDLFAEASSELGLLFSSLLVLGTPFMTKALGAGWWSWDGRLMLIRFLWLFYVCYFLLRRSAEESHKARTTAIFGSLCVFVVPAGVYFLRWWQTFFPAPRLITPGGGHLASEVLATLQVCLVTFICLFVYLLQQRFVIAHMQLEVDRIRRSIADHPVQYGFLVENQNYVIEEYNFQEYDGDD
jgi:heme exporter protein C